MIVTVFLSILVVCGASRNEEEAADGELFIASTRSIYRMKMDGTEKIIVANATNATSVDYHHPKRLLFWSDVGTHKIYRKDLYDDSSEIVTVIEGPDDWEPRSIAVDFVNDKIYAIDQRARKIDVFELDGTRNVTGVLRNLTEPEHYDWMDDKGPNTDDIVVDPYTGYIFYGVYNKVYRASMDLSSHTYISRKSLVSGLTIDRERKRLYHADSYKILYEINYDGLRTNMVSAYEHVTDYLRGTPMAPKSISKFSGNYYWLDARTEQYPGIHKLTGYFSEPVHEDLQNAWALRVRHPSLQDTSPSKITANGCRRNKCEYMCLVNGVRLDKNDEITHDHSCFNEKGEIVGK